jgi:hypothetical protein
MLLVTVVRVERGGKESKGRIDEKKKTYRTVF